MNKAKHEQEAKLEAMKQEFVSFLVKKRKVYDETKNERTKLLGFDEDNCVSEEYLIEVEHIKESKEE